MLSEVERFVNWTRRRSPEARTWKDYGYDLRIFIQVVGDRLLKDITFRDIDHFVVVQSEKGFKPSTINRRLASVISLYGFLLPDDDELVCPVIVRRHHVREHQRLPRPVDEESLKRFFAVIPCGHNVTDKRDRAMFLLMLRCGLRIGEVAALRLGDRPPREITFRDIDHFVGAQSEKGFKPSTINRRLASVISLYGFLLPEDDELVCPVIVRRHHVREHQRLPRPVDEESLKRFFSVMPCGHNVTDKRDRAMFLLMLRCGLRIGEVASGDSG
jgi:site-specific recombinase XerD